NAQFPPPSTTGGFILAVARKYQPQHQQREQLRGNQGQTDNSWGLWAIGDHGALPKLSKKPLKKVPGASHGAPY
ncbi:unnamed protein product, partial [Staurois parvus]